MYSISRLRRIPARWFAATVVALTCVGASLPAAAQTLTRIEETKTIRVGVLLENAPFGFIDEKGTPTGLNIDVANAIARELGVEIEVVPTTNTSRIANLVTGGIDIAVATIGMLPSRAEVIQFSEPYTVFENIVVGPKDRDISSFEDLAGLRVGVGQGAASEATMLERAPPTATVQSFADRAANLQALTAGQVDVIADDNLVLIVLEEAAPGRYEQKFVTSQLWVGAGLPKGQPDLLKAINAIIDGMRASGELGEIHKKWRDMPEPEWPDKVEGVPFAIDD